MFWQISSPALARFFLSILLGLAGSAGAAAEPRLLLDDLVPIRDVWPAVRVLHDPDMKFGVETALAAAQDFAAPQGAHAVLGLRKKQVWLRLPLAVSPQSDGKWVLDLDYTLLNRIDVYLVTGGKPGLVAQIGNTQPFEERPLASRTHAVPLVLAPGAHQELLIRIDTKGSMILAMTLSKPAAFHHRAINEQMLQGLLASIGLCLLLYSLLKWFSLREPLYIKYALLISGSVLFSVHFFGLGELYLWTDQVWLETHMAGLTSLIAACGTALFVEDVLRADMGKRLRAAMKLLAGALALSALLHGLDVIDIHQVSIVMSTLGLLPALMGVPGAIARVKRGDSVGAYFLFAWVGYFIASAIMVGVVKGSVGANFWTMHSFQFGATFDMLMFMRIAVLRSSALHHAARAANRERDTLHSMAHSDPLTGLLNRRGLNSSLAAALHNCTPEELLAVYMLDLDEFKPVNDQHGHDVGDELLAIVAQRLRATMRNGDVIARVGGDEFVVMAGNLHSDQQARELGGKLLEAFREPFAMGQQNCRVGVTIGYVLAPLDGHDPVALMKTADAAMYAGKQRGKGSLTRGGATSA